MTTLDDLFDPHDLKAAVDAGHVRVAEHGDLRIYNYTERAQWDWVWTPVTRRCRGLIATSDGRVIARPWPKFHNYGEAGTAALDLTAPVEVTDKMDGSLGIIYPTGDGLAVATRGAFRSEQALHATELLRTRYSGWQPPTGVTVLVEIIFPGNRIVVDYGDTDDLVLLGAVDIATGDPYGPGAVPDWPGPVTETFQCATLADALQMEPRPGAEGVVVRFIGGEMVKIKQPDYVALHKIITGLNERVVWERLGVGETAADICAEIPDEFHAWVGRVAHDLQEAARERRVAAEREHAAILADVGDDWTRKDYAIRAAKSELRPWLFLLLDGKDPDSAIWKSLRPEGATLIAARGEDVA